MIFLMWSKSSGYLRAAQVTGEQGGLAQRVALVVGQVRVCTIPLSAERTAASRTAITASASTGGTGLAIWPFSASRISI